MSRNSDQAVDLFLNGYNCAQAVLTAVGCPLGLPRETALRVAGAFGGGIGRMGGTCGAVSGAYMAIGLKFAKVGPQDDAPREKGYALAQEFAARFTERHGHTGCKELLGCDLSTAEGRRQAVDEQHFRTICPALVRDAVELVEELLSRQDGDTLRQAVQEKYAAVAQSTLSGEHAGVRAVAQAFGYTPEELAAIPKNANMGLSCGNPTAMASLKPGEVVVDLGAGGGLDVFLAAQKVGPAGRAIGIDMTPAMIDRARQNAREAGYANVEFHLATIDRIPLPDASVDVVISNCVINLAPDKSAVFREIARILKPGGRLAASDIALKKPLPAELAQDIMAYVGCIAGAIGMNEYRDKLLAAGFAHVQIVDSGADLNAYAKVENQAACCAPPMNQPAPKAACCSPAAASPCCGDKKPDLFASLKDLVSRYNVNDYAASVKVFAVKP